MKIERLILQVSGVATDEAQRLAQSIAQELALTPAPRRARLGVLRVEVTAPEQDDMDELAHRVANEILRQVARGG